eukprot:gene16013-biopygen9293
MSEREGVVGIPLPASSGRPEAGRRAAAPGAVPGSRFANSVPRGPNPVPRGPNPVPRGPNPVPRGPNPVPRGPIRCLGDRIRCLGDRIRCLGDRIRCRPSPSVTLAICIIWSISAPQSEEIAISGEFLAETLPSLL